LFDPNRPLYMSKTWGCLPVGSPEILYFTGSLIAMVKDISNDAIVETFTNCSM